VRVFSPYQFNPMNYNPLRYILEQSVDFERLRAGSDIKLFLSATNVRSGKVRIFKTDEVTPDAVLASACLPFIFQAVEIDGEAYWDGGYAGNPSLMPLVTQSSADDLLLVLNPDEGSLIDGLKVQETARILGVNVRGIVLNRYDMKGQKYGKAQIEAHFGTQVIAMLPEDANVRRKDRVPVVMASPGSKTAQEIVKVARLVSGHTDAQTPALKPFTSRLMEALFKA